MAVVPLAVDHSPLMVLIPEDAAKGVLPEILTEPTDDALSKALVTEEV